MRHIYKFTVSYKGKPDYIIPSNDQMMLSPLGRLMVCYPEDHDEDPNEWHDVTEQYDITVEVSKDTKQEGTE